MTGPTVLPPDLLSRFQDDPDCPAGPVTLDDLAAHWLRAPLDGPVTWAQACAYVITEVPDWAWEFITCALPRLSSPMEAVLLAAGPVEDLVNSSGLIMIDRIEALAESSARFRFVLTGIEFPQTTDPALTPVYERIAQARATAMRRGITTGGPLPPSDNSA
ncbi:DUF6869 domain-containing protein [Thioclava sp. GXIMD4216]|uniref:DUF6869 domain-containing protein n=1 Tax=Thioclava litoralis TaxID=3076557 RepID=A0ABZ1DWG8_9RHOB|nr:hypothetical protein RPE78_10510 [Thioclava sp. FTW29]